MNDLSDQQLLRDYASRHSESAFAELVRRHVDLVYSAALRLVVGVQAAEDVTQTVFVALARQAPQLTRHSALSGWLHCTTRNVAAKTVRSEVRRRVREEEVAVMNELLANDSTAIWEHIAPRLDAALGELNAAERDAVLLRYFEKKSAQEMAQILGVSHEAAQKRVSRGVERLREIFAKYGVSVGVGGLATIISINAVQAAPAGLAATIATASILSAGSGTITLLKIMTMTKIKLGISALVVAGTATALVVQHQNQTKLRDENGALQQQIAQLQTDNESFSNRLAAAGDAKKLPDDQFNELLKLRGEVGVLRGQIGELGKLREENKRLQIAQADAKTQQQATAEAEEQYREAAILKMNIAKQGVLGLIMFADDNQQQFPTNFAQATPYFGSSKDLVATNFDIIYQGSITNIAKPAETIVLKEKQAWQALNGTWDKTYGFADGHSEVHTEPNGNFDDYEKDHMILPPANQ